MEKILQNNRSFLSSKKVFFGNPDKIVKLVSTLNKDRIIIVSGMRFTGKTRFISEMITKTRIGDKAFYFNTELDTLGKIKTSHDIEKLIQIHTNTYQKPQILILQNISKIEGIKDFIAKVYEEKKYKMIIVGNNLKIEGVEEIEINTLKISKLFESQDNIETEITDIGLYGSIEEVALVKDIYMKKFMLENISSSIISKDIVYAYSIKNNFLYNQTLSFLSSISDYASLREINRKLAGNNIDISLITTIDYINFTLNSKLVKRMYRYDLKLQKEITSKAKYYFSDTGIRNTIHGIPLDNNTIIENLIYNKFIKKGYSVQGGIYGRFEFDFIAKSGADVKDKDIYLHISKESDKNEIQKQARKLAKASLETKQKSIKIDTDIFDEAPIGHGEIEDSKEIEKIKKILLVHNLNSINIRKKNINGVEIVDLYEFMKSF